MEAAWMAVESISDEEDERVVQTLLRVAQGEAHGRP
jgi:hypothetical protein